ncbi:hypothetical protein LguiA_010754 [Lonicera macranthoides]
MLQRNQERGLTVRVQAHNRRCRENHKHGEIGLRCSHLWQATYPWNQVRKLYSSLKLVVAGTDNEE